MKRISDFNFSGKKALIRVDFNVPQNEEGEVTDTTRILAAKPTIDKVIQDGGSVILMTHLGRPKGQKNEKYSLKAIVSTVAEVLGKEVQFASDCIGEVAEQAVSNLKGGDILLLENLRFYNEEEAGNEDFAKKLAQLGDVYINDAFGTAHRKHASTAVVAEYFPEDKMFGFLMEKELDAIDKVLHNGEKPVTAVIGGAKVSSKITIIENILPVVDNIIIGGGMSFTFIKAQGGKIGTSLVEEDKQELALQILESAKKHNVKVYLPVDVKGVGEFSNDAEITIYNSNEIPDDKMGLDCGPKTSEIFDEVIKSSKTILWNGPLGVFEMSNFAVGTINLGNSIAEANKQGAFSLVGGGDSVAFAKQYGYDSKVSYVSTGGGAMLESLEGRELPGVAAIKA
ncbi:phosphoglycerate kinase [Elizabethkingia sp. JS20170427COW]|uniref:phosphoglycerate kinase n=1 Tax=Elizabethkingia sp. JS20170427COW TaxID=2583851 RepID=UPI0011101CF7|nr:phosphoglycerate kinase [Elizabethkingia sp. JS20170427COW]QCX53126.1 phosphoglycerate kinase [Elizabethkingia sp. JS20170427COW]